ncbi:hypothetical protein HRbin06_01026 [archaeon HR06]|nr:hypothetical protein HRbin06_01026 [archaeon HR06]
MVKQFCLECGGELFFDPSAKAYVCKSCGLFLTKEQLRDLKEKYKLMKDEDLKKKKHSEYLEWWLSKKK